MKPLKIVQLVGPLALGLAFILAAACGPVAGQGNNNQPTGDGQVGECTPGEILCEGTTAKLCTSLGTWHTEICPSACVVGEGCVDCITGAFYCEDDWVMVCTEDKELEQAYQCPPEQACILGECVTKCDPRVLTPSNVGCEFWAVDLDNEASTTFGISNDAAAAQYAVAVANNNDFTVYVEVFKNTARVGQPVSEVLERSVSVPPRSLERIDLPQREVDGTMGQNGAYVVGSGSGTFVSPHAYRVVSNGPVVAYQFNPVVQQYSNDASILIPMQALGTQYYVMGYPTANPCGIEGMSIESIPDHTAVTIVGVHENTLVTVYPTHPVMASGGDSGFQIDETPAGGEIQFEIGPYEVVNLESLQPMGDIMNCITLGQTQNGDFTGTRVVATKNVVVFSSNERGLAGGEAEPRPPNWNEETCCTDHLEQQMFPITALGWNFVVSRSPVRSTGGYREPDVYRVLATVNGTTVTTSLSNFPSFTLNAGEFKSFWAQDGFTVGSQGGAIMLGQFLVSQGFTQGGNGDSTFTIFPAVDQHRKEYVFLILDTFTDNYMVLAMPNSAAISINGQAQGEFPQGCSTEDIGMMDNQMYIQMTCRMEPGVHTVSATQPVGLTIYGYYNVGSYGYPGGSDVKIINPIG